MRRNFSSTCLLLCEKVREVLDNNDWPTIEGQETQELLDDGKVCLIRDLVNQIEGELA